jgi:uncharacterized protein
MQLDLSRFRGETDHIERQYDPDRLSLEDDDFRLVDAVQLVADLRRDGRKVRLTGRVTTRLECDCSRCLEPLQVPVDSAFDLLYLPASEGVAPERAEPAGETEIDDDDVGVTFYRDDVIDLGEMMREQFFLALPMKPVCRDECRGLCPVCGINRNREVCSCESAWTDPRLDALRKLRDNQ